MPRHEILVAEKAGTLLRYKNKSKVHEDVNYASITAPELVRVNVFLDDELFDSVWVAPGSSHSWWTPAGGKFLDHNGLNPGQTLTVVTTGPCALRLDWI